MDPILPNSIGFYIFFAGVFLAHLISPQRTRWFLLLAASALFYALLDLRYLLLLAATTGIDFFLALSIAKRVPRNQAARRLLIFSIVLNLGLLFGFKYATMFATSFGNLIGMLGITFTIPHINVIIPLGISFFTFKKISYIVDVYKGAMSVERHLGHFALYVSFFLEIVAGPIDRARDLLPAIKAAQRPRWDDMQAGILLVLYGLFLKVVVADRLSVYTDAVFNNVAFHNGPSLVVAAYFYAFQIFADFAGYTNIALGCGRMLGYRLHPNFNQPYFAQSISDFWRRWHMSLSYWFRDYLYIPLGGNRVNRGRWYLNLMVVFLICGLWHGANWSFVVWGGIHGLYLVASNISAPWRKTLCKMISISDRWSVTIRIMVTFHLVVFAWIFFRANSLTDAMLFIEGLTAGWPKFFIDGNSMGHGLIGILILSIVEYLQYRGILDMERVSIWPVTARWLIAYFFIMMIVIAGVNSDSAFIYYQF